MNTINFFKIMVEIINILMLKDEVASRYEIKLWVYLKCDTAYTFNKYTTDKCIIKDKSVKVSDRFPTW